ncbi:MAG: beta-lactamase family protein [Spirochaetes bacterium]|nr:beta-lactamase family protein [Spirochaetota bacterium]
MEYIVTDFVNNDDLVKNCVLSVNKGDGSFSWSGAAGIANRESQALMTKDTPFCLASITKLYTAAIIMRLYEDGKISLDDPMSKYLPEKLIHHIHVYEGKDYSAEITIKHLLSHTSGIADYYSENPEGGKSLFEIFLENPGRKWTVEDTIKRARDDLKPDFPPGTDASYSDTNFQLLGLIIETVAQKPLHSVYEDIIFHPLGLRHTWLIGHPENLKDGYVVPADVFYEGTNINELRSNGSYWADGGMVSTSEEMFIFLKALNEGKIIRKSNLESMHNWHKLSFPLEYGYGTMYFKLPKFIAEWSNLPPLWGHSGSTGSFLYYSEDMDLYLAGTINQAESQSKPFFGLISKVIKAVKSGK